VAEFWKNEEGLEAKSTENEEILSDFEKNIVDSQSGSG
jgi:hypothetical protein